MDSAYELFRNGTRAAGATATSTPPSSRWRRARDLEPDKASIREALGRALFGAQRYGEAAAEFEAVVEHAPTNDYALFCLGRSLQLLGRHAEARQPLALASCLRPERADYRAVPRPGPPPRGLSRAARRTPRTGERGPTVLSCSHSFRGRPPAGVVRKRALARFFVVRKEDG